MNLEPGLPPPRRGRRDNGLDASAFTPLGDVDPRVGEHLLEVLKDAGIAAYLEPHSELNPYTRAMALPSPPRDRLWVDRASDARAANLIAEHSAEPTADARASGHTLSGVDEDAAWAQLVADFDRDIDVVVPPWPVDEDVPDLVPEPREDPNAAADSADEDEGPPEKPGPAPDDPEDHFQPPPPPPIPFPAPGTLGAVLMLALGALLLVAPSVLGIGTDAGFVLGVLGIVSGVGMLVWRVRERPDDGDDDNGAIV